MVVEGVRSTEMAREQDANLAEIIDKIRILLTGDNSSASEPASVVDDLLSARIQRLTVLAQQVFGDEAKAQVWLTEPQPHFRGKSILQLASRGDVASQIEEALRRIDEERIFRDPRGLEP
ncbi:conserved hypothetical protein [Candidatus Terasakiella magnetica]|nr:conserved hypothetical protein [Candidatus Terasakiella magnetica]